MPRTQLSIFGGFYENQSIPLSQQNCINWIPQVAEDGALNAGALMTPQALAQFGTLGTAPNRGAQVMGGVPFFVNGTSLFSMDSSGTPTTIGTITGTARVSMANNGTKLCIVVPGGDAFVWNGSTLVQITDSDYITADTVIFKDGFYVFTASDGSVFFSSALNDPTSFDALDFASAELSPDDIVAAHVNHNELFILGEKTIEVFQNVGGSGFPFQRIPGANIQKGCYAKFSPIEFDNTFLFVGGGLNERAAIWRVVSSQLAQKLSTDAIDNAIQKFTQDEIAAAFSYTFTIGGQFIAAFTFESNAIASITFCYNATSQKWFQLQSGAADNKWRVNSIVSAHDKLLCGDEEDGRIGYLTEVFSEYGETIYRERTTQPFITNGDSQFWPEVELTMESGVGLTTGQGEDPQIRMSFSDNGGRTFSAEQSRSFGKIGEYKKRPIWRRNGRVPMNRVLRFTTTDPVKANMVRLDGVLEQGYG